MSMLRQTVIKAEALPVNVCLATFCKPISLWSVLSLQQQVPRFTKGLFNAVWASQRTPWSTKDSKPGGYVKGDSRWDSDQWCQNWTANTRGIGEKENRLGLDLLNLSYRHGNFYGIGNTHLQLRRNHHTGNAGELNETQAWGPQASI